MLRIKLSKLKQVCVTAFIPKILKDSKTLLKDTEKCSIDYFNKTTYKKYKSTDSGSKDDDSISKRKAIIDQCFSDKPQLLYEKDATTERLSKDKAKLCETEDKNKSLRATILNKDLFEQKDKEEVHNTDVQAIAAKIEEVKIAHDIINNDKTMDVETDRTKDALSLANDNSTLVEKADVEINGGKAVKLSQNIVQIDRTPQINVEDAKPEGDFNNSNASSLLQHTNVQTTTGNIGDEKLAENTNTRNISEALQKAENEATELKVETEKLAQQIVHIDKSPLADIRTTEGKDFTNTLSVSEALQKDEDRATAAELEKEKLLQRTINIAKDNLSSKPSELEDSVNVRATTAKIEEEKLAQKIDNIEETPHVEAANAKVEGFNISPKILGHDANPNLNISEPESDPSPDQPGQVNLDELAKKCLGKPDGDIDQILLKELKYMTQGNSLKINLPKDGSSQQYFSQILQDKTKDNNNIVFDISEAHLEQVLHSEIKGLTVNELKSDNFHPFHLDTVPIVTTDTRDYKEEFNKKYSPEGVKNLLLDIPAVLDPYGMQAIPFYQYVSKENIALKEIPSKQVSTQESTVEIVQETEINTPMNEEVILKREERENIQNSVLNNDIKYLEDDETKDYKTTTANTVKPAMQRQIVTTNTVGGDLDSNSKTTEKSGLSESDVAKLLEYRNVLTAQQEASENVNPNIVPIEISTTGAGDQSTKSPVMERYPLKNATQNLLTTSTPTPTDPFGNPIDTEAGQPKVFGAEQDRQSYERRTDTAISANQNPEEYFPRNQFNSFIDVSIQQVEYVVTDSSVPYTGVFDTKTTYGDTVDEQTTDNLMSHSISYYSTFPQLSDFSESSKEAPITTTLHLNEKECVTHTLLQPEPKPQNIQLETIKLELKEEEFNEEMVQRKPRIEFQKGITQQQPKKKDIAEASIAKEGDISLSDETLPLSVLLKLVRERSRLELIRSVTMEATVAKKEPCIPPLDRTKPKTTMNPSPCKPKPKEEQKCPSPCKPEKKDPCAKFVPFFLHTFLKTNFDFSVPPNTRYDQIYVYISLAKEIALKKLLRLGHILGFLNIRYKYNDTDEIICARDFDPWVPIPSWPIPEIEKKRPFKGPKEGCKLPVHPVRSNTDKPCLGVPKKISPSKTVN